MNMKFLMGSVLVLSSSVLAFETWVGIDGVYRIKTELDNGTGTSGYWYEFDDSAEGGESELDWHGISLKTDYSDLSFDKVIERCGGLCGSAELRTGTLTFNPYVGIAFNVAGTATETGGAPTRADAVDWDGICVAYTSDIDLSVELSMSDSVDKAIRQDYPKVILPKSATTTYECNEWLDFVQAGWGVNGMGGVPITSLEAAAALASVRFTFQGRDGSYNFEIRAVGPYTAKGDFERIVERIIARDDSVAAEYARQDSIAKVVAESRQDSIAAEMNRLDSIDNEKSGKEEEPKEDDSLEVAKGTFETWYGDDGSFRIKTGLDNGMNTSGYWYYISDKSDGGKSKVEWESYVDGLVVDQTSGPMMDVIIDENEAVCGTAVLKANSDPLFVPYAGVAFDVAGTKTEDGGPVTAADASDWGGICITYTSEIEPVLEIGFTAKGDSAVAYDFPAARLPKASSPKTRCVAWSDFEQAGWGKKKGGVSISGEKAATKIASVKFVLQDDPGSYKFKIYAVGPYGSLGGGDLVKGFRVASSAKAVLSNKKLSFTGVTSAATVQVVDVLGHVMVKASVEPTSTLDLSRLKAGRYIVRVAGKDVDFTTGITLK